jgi:hypothetical protein
MLVPTVFVLIYPTLFTLCEVLLTLQAIRSAHIADLSLSNDSWTVSKTIFWQIEHYNKNEEMSHVFEAKGSLQ